MHALTVLGAEVLWAWLPWFWGLTRLKWGCQLAGLLLEALRKHLLIRGAGSIWFLSQSLTAGSPDGLTLSKSIPCGQRQLPARATAMSSWGVNAFILKKGIGQKTPASTAKRH